ncbi:MAG TPA: hypothetical protein DCQ92_00870 [Verrucomicrobia subdivision 3 bacterium]|nr:hypothetical protein [Limisphaerales bacterium]
MAGIRLLVCINAGQLIWNMTMMTMSLKANLGCLCLMLMSAIAPAWGATSVMVEDFEKSSSPFTVWVVNIPNENASVQLSPDQPHDGKQCLKLHYHFVGAGSYQYLGIPIKVKIQMPVHKLRFWLKGDNSKCSYGVRVNDAGGETHQFSNNSGQGGIIDFTGWREAVIDLDSGHETWGGDKNGRIDYPITEISFTIGQPKDGANLLPVESDLGFDSLRVDSDRSANEILGGQVSVTSPAYCSEIKGNMPINISAPGFKQVIAKCWKQGGALGSDSTVATLDLDKNGNGSFMFPADAYPHGPITVRINGANGALKDNCYLQLYNQGGVAWNEGMPKDPPLAAKGMSLVFADDFNGRLSISSTDSKATYYDHKPPGGSQDFSIHTFSGYDSAKNPFSQADTYLRIRASDKTHSSGLISSLKNDASGITAKAPCYFECRFIGPNAIGTWPAFWLLTDYMTDQVKGIKVPCDELDIVEAYGGEGPHEPNAHDSYMITPHCWDQGEAGKAIEKQAFDGMHSPIHLRKFGIDSTWFETFHTYGCKITETDTIYYCDNIEVGRHATLPRSKQSRFFFLINLATGGGWPVDLSRYHGLADMYVDYVRVYQQAQ